MSIPLSASERSEIIPASLANLPAAPVFTFRPATERDARAFRQACRVQGLTMHSMADFRAAIRSELQMLWDKDSFDVQMPKLQALWDTIDYNSRKPEEERVAIDPDEQAAADELMQRLGRASKLLRSMEADNEQFMEDSPKLAIGQFLIGWKNITAPFRKEAGVIPLDCIDGLEKALLAMERQAVADKVEGAKPGEAFAEIALHAFGLLNLSGVEAGNSASPSAPGPIPNSLDPTHNPQRMTAGGSPKSERSRKTRGAK